MHFDTVLFFFFLFRHFCVDDDIFKLLDTFVTTKITFLVNRQVAEWSLELVHI